MAVLDPFGVAADLLDPPVWEPADRPPLEPHQIDHGAWPVRGVSWGSNVNARAAASLRGLGLVSQRPPYFTRVLLTDKGQEVLDA